MNDFRAILLAAAVVGFLGTPRRSTADDDRFPPELVHFEPYQGNPIFAGTGKDTWDRTIRERGYLLREGDTWHFWYTTNVAVSEDLIHWTKYGKNPIIPTDHSSGTLVHDGHQYRLYTAHPDVRVYFAGSLSSTR